MLLIIDYFANFCDSGHCANENTRCTYPVYKSAPAENLTGASITGRITKILIEVDARDKFHYTYDTEINWDCEILINNKNFCHFQVPCNNHVEDISYTILDPKFDNDFFSNNMKIECKLYAGPFVACPYALDLIIYTEE